MERLSDIFAVTPFIEKHANLERGNGTSSGVQEEKSHIGVIRINELRLTSTRRYQDARGSISRRTEAVVEGEQSVWNIYLSYALHAQSYVLGNGNGPKNSARAKPRDKKIWLASCQGARPQLNLAYFLKNIQCVLSTWEGRSNTLRCPMSRLKMNLMNVVSTPLRSCSSLRPAMIATSVAFICS